MKKLLVIGFSAVLILGACSEGTATDTTTEEQAAPAEEATESSPTLQQELMRFYMTVPNTINGNDADLNTFEAAQAEDALPEGEELQKMKEAAKAAAEKTSAAVESIEISEALEEQKSEIESALASIKESYDMKAEELTKEASFEAANAKFQEADEQLNALLEDQGLNPSSIQNEVSK